VISQRRLYDAGGLVQNGGSLVVWGRLRLNVPTKRSSTSGSRCFGNGPGSYVRSFGGFPGASPLSLANSSSNCAIRAATPIPARLPGSTMTRSIRSGCFQLIAKVSVC
jgi:hypothetical protein